MKRFKLFVALMALLRVAVCAETAFAGEQGPLFEKKLGVGKVQVRDFGVIKLHSYETMDPLGDVCFLLETPHNLVAVESPAFDDSISEWKAYTGALNKPLTDILIASHPTGGKWYGNATSHATEGARQAIASGSTRKLALSLGETFGKGFNTDIAEIDSVLSAGKNTIGGIDLEIIEAGDGYEIFVPAINILYIHMLGADSHSILAGEEHIKSVLASLRDMKARKCRLVLSAHHAPETLADVDTKIAYVENVRTIAAKSKDRKDFVEQMKKAYPNYAGMNYLDMTAGYLFAN